MSLAWIPVDDSLVRWRRPVQFEVKYSGAESGREWRGDAPDEETAEVLAAEALMDEGLSWETAAALVLPAEPVQRWAQR